LALALRSRRHESAPWAAVFVSIIVVAANIAVLELERGGAGNINNAEDAVWCPSRRSPRSAMAIGIR
jgi:hypothetical protein